MKQEYHRNHFLLILYLVIFSTNCIYADYYYPQKIEVNQSFEGGLLLYDSASQRSYFVKPNWESSQDVISTWQGLEKTNSIGKPIGDNQILTAIIVSGNLLLVTHNFNNSFLQLYNNNLDLIAIAEFSEDLTINPNSINIKKANDSLLYILYAENLYKISISNNFFEIFKTATQISDFEFINRRNTLLLALLENHNNKGILRILDTYLNEKTSTTLNIALINEIQNVGNYLLIKSSYESSNSTLVNIYDLNKNKIIASKYFESDINNIAFISENDNINIYWISSESGQYLLNITTFLLLSNKFTYKQNKLPAQIFERIKLQSIGNDVYLFFRNAVLIYNQNDKIQLFDFLKLGNNYKEEFKIQKINNNLIVSSKYYSEIYDIKEDQFWWLKSFANTLWTYIIPILLFILLVVFVRLYTKEKQLFKEFINLPSIGAIFIINNRGELTITNQYSKELLALDKSTLLGKPFESYCTAEFSKPIYDFYKHFDEIKESISQRISLHKQNGTLEYIFNISPEWSITGKYEGAIIIAFNITEEIERKRLSNWAQIAHDMQTNLATIKLNAEQLKNQANPELSPLISRIYNQVLILQKRVRDIVTVGRSSNLEIIQTYSLDLLNEVIMEFDESLFPEVEISSNADQFQIYCDKPKLVRALRNAIENGIKALPDRKGKISISAYQQGRFTYFSIKDNGKGMDEDVRKKMLTPYFTTSKDGTGFGIGTLIIQEVVELHSGSLEIITEKNEGTELIIKIPNRLKKLAIN